LTYLACLTMSPIFTPPAMNAFEFAVRDSSENLLAMRAWQVLHATLEWPEHLRAHHELGISGRESLSMTSNCGTASLAFSHASQGLSQCKKFNCKHKKRAERSTDRSAPEMLAMKQSRHAHALNAPACFVA
jgi:hypothetical protein